MKQNIVKIFQQIKIALSWQGITGEPFASSWYDGECIGKFIWFYFFYIGCASVLDMFLIDYLLGFDSVYFTIIGSFVDYIWPEIDPPNVVWVIAWGLPVVGLLVFGFMALVAAWFVMVALIFALMQSLNQSENFKDNFIKKFNNPYF